MTITLSYNFFILHSYQLSGFVTLKSRLNIMLGIATLWPKMLVSGIADENISSYLLEDSSMGVS